MRYTLRQKFNRCTSKMPVFLYVSSIFFLAMIFAARYVLYGIPAMVITVGKFYLLLASFLF